MEVIGHASQKLVWSPTPPSPGRKAGRDARPEAGFFTFCVPRNVRPTGRFMPRGASARRHYKSHRNSLKDASQGAPVRLSLSITCLPLFGIIFFIGHASQKLVWSPTPPSSGRKAGLIAVSLSKYTQNNALLLPYLMG
uniref:Uncharacterized protein n=1 Tax=Glossina brevipalpis TaxID=37001 RepID=A0A1A9WSJ6_9MUSC